MIHGIESTDQLAKLFWDRLLRSIFAIDITPEVFEKIVKETRLLQ
jgi:hypothetical protein